MKHKCDVRKAEGETALLILQLKNHD
jgi:hypothetical protein